MSPRSAPSLAGEDMPMSVPISRSLSTSSIWMTVSASRKLFCCRPWSTWAANPCVRGPIEPGPGGTGRTKDATHLADDLDIGGARCVVGSDSIDDPNNVTLDHPDVVDVPLLLRQLEEMLDEIHDVGLCVDGSLRLGSSSALLRINRTRSMPTSRVAELTFSSCSRMHEWRSSSMSLYLMA